MHSLVIGQSTFYTYWEICGIEIFASKYSEGKIQEKHFYHQIEFEHLFIKLKSFLDLLKLYNNTRF